MKVHPRDVALTLYVVDTDTDARSFADTQSQVALPVWGCTSGGGCTSSVGVHFRCVGTFLV